MGFAAEHTVADVSAVAVHAVPGSGSRKPLTSWPGALGVRQPLITFLFLNIDKQSLC